MDRVLVVDKPSGVTSHDVVRRIRRSTGVRKVGHAGTLDPAATGVLVVLLGKATRLSQFLVEADKEYRGEIVLGLATTTQDAAGEPVERGVTDGIGEDEVRSAFSKLTGELEQVPPMVSAIKREGTPLYVLARRGVTVEREPRRVYISRFDLLTYDVPVATFEVECSKGTYVRTLAADVGEALGCGAHLGRLARTRVGRFTIDEAMSLDDLEKMAADASAAGYSMYDALAPWPAVHLTDDESESVCTGGAISVETSRAQLKGGEFVRLTEDGVELVAVGQAVDSGDPGRLDVRPVKVFAAI